MTSGPSEAPTPAQAPTSGLAIASLVLGILGVVTLGLTALVGLILGIVGLIQVRRSRGTVRGAGLAVGGIIVSAVMMLLVPGFLAALLYPVYDVARERAREAECIAHMHAIGTAIRLYHTDNRRFPAPEPDPDDPRLQRGGIAALYLTAAIANSQALVCPNDRSPLAAETRRQRSRGPHQEAVYSSYSVDEQGRPLYNYWGLDDQGIAYRREADAPESPPGMPGPDDPQYPALRNANAPDETIVTHCPRHRVETGTTQLELILHLGGDIEKVPFRDVKWMVSW